MGFLYVHYSNWLLDFFIGNSSQSFFNFYVWRLFNNAINPWRWVSIFAAWYLVRSPARLVELEEMWVTRLKPREIILGKFLAGYFFYFLLFMGSFISSIIFSNLFQSIVSPGNFFSLPGNQLTLTILANPVYYIYMIMAPFYAASILFAIFLLIPNRPLAFLIIFAVYLVIFPFLQDQFVQYSYDWSWPLQRWFERNVSRESGVFTTRDIIISIEYLSRSVSLALISLPFALVLFWKYPQMALKQFESRHF